MLNQVTTLWAYGSLDERVERRRELFQDPAWIAYLTKARPLLTTQETRILAAGAVLQRAAGRDRCAWATHHDRASAGCDRGL